MTTNDLPEVYLQLAGRFGETGDVLSAEGLTLEQVRKYVRSHVVHLLETNLGILMSILYRIDVPEAQVQDVLRRTGHDAIPDALTELILERQLQKVRLRRTYKDEEDG